MKKLIQRFSKTMKKEKKKLTDEALLLSCYDELIEEEEKKEKKEKKDNINSLEKVSIKLDFGEKATEFETEAFEEALSEFFVNIIENIEGVGTPWVGDLKTTNKFIKFEATLKDK